MFYPSYIKLHQSGELSVRANKLKAMLADCDICPKDCRVNRINNEIAACYSGYNPVVSSYCVHFGEEPVLVGSKEFNNENGVGNIFFGNCNLRCVYCQNYEISQNHRTEIKNEVTIARLAQIMLELQSKNVNAIGLVSPTHFVPQIILALDIAVSKGLCLPLVYNTNSYDSFEVIKLLEGIIDVYLPDLKYSENEYGYKYSKIKNYVKHSREAIAEMHRQVGSEVILENNIMKRGLIIRHLILPNDIAGSYETLKFISELDNNINLSVMSQYYPIHKALSTDLLSRNIREREYVKVLDMLDELCLENGFLQEFESESYYRPDFKNREEPFKK
ncbi:MAG TPA: radical SAM protein [Ignavibacteria bacterium]|nr:radical SAM protein [Ignavibacteria bacterium]